MSTFKVGHYYYYEFQIDGTNFRKSTRRKNKKEADEIERIGKAKVEADLEMQKRGGSVPIMWIDVANRYWEEKGRGSSNSKGVFHALELLTAFFGTTKRLDEITGNDLARLVTWRHQQTAKGRGQKSVSSATVNRLVQCFRTIRRYAQSVWQCHLPPDSNWKGLLLKEDRPPPRELSNAEEQAIYAHVRPDYLPWLYYALITGLRLAETRPKWSDVDWEAGVITGVGKGGKAIRTVITPALRELLEPLKGHHKEYVFTYVAKRRRKGEKKGERRPLTYAGIKSEWQAHRKRAGVKGVKLHGFRHDVGHKANRLGGLKLASSALNHSDIGVTAKHYVGTPDAELAALMQRVAEGRLEVLRKSLRADVMKGFKPLNDQS